MLLIYANEVKTYVYIPRTTMKLFLLLIIFGMCASRELERHNIERWVRNLHHICHNGKCKRYIMGAPIHPSTKVYSSLRKCRAVCRGPVYVCEKNKYCILNYVDDGPNPEERFFSTFEECNNECPPKPWIWRKH
ncbi:unnamed protein product [Cylicocyclus nassatus]|uniref:Uncharacterized protein n=1 Tax=Cylicocyclus nassatus TaxID=53992 RepID=A0AA36M6H8_CYLNA|nr:unnamed protein product [Cylicocyclus nassatus]